MLCYAMLCYAMLCYAVLCYAMLCYAMLCYAMLCYAMLCYAMLCCAMLYGYLPSLLEAPLKGSRYFTKFPEHLTDAGQVAGVRGGQERHLPAGKGVGAGRFLSALRGQSTKIWSIYAFCIRNRYYGSTVRGWSMNPILEWYH